MARKKAVERFEVEINARGDYIWAKITANNKQIAHGEGYETLSNVRRFLNKENRKLKIPIPIIEKF